MSHRIMFSFALLLSAIAFAGNRATTVDNLEIIEMKRTVPLKYWVDFSWYETS